MADIEMPQLGETVTEGTITKWFKNVGDQVAEDEPLFEVSTDKVDSEVPAPTSGYLAEILVAEGETVDVGTKLAVLTSEAPAGGGGAEQQVRDEAAAADSAEQEEEAARAEAGEPAQEDEAAAAKAEPAEPEVEEAVAAEKPAEAAPTQVQQGREEAAASRDGEGTDGNGAAGRLLSPVVRRLIQEHDLDPSSIKGTGAGGRITRNDVLEVVEKGGGVKAPPRPAPSEEKAPARAPAAAGAPARAAQPMPAARAGDRDTVKPFTNIRRRTAEHMIRSRATSAHAMAAIEVDFEAVDRVRRAAKDEWRAAEGFSLTYLPFISRAVIDALEEFPEVNASVGDDELVVHNYVNLGIAVDINFEGLLVPVIHDADGLRLRAIARSISDLANRARTKKLSPDDLSNGTFTITNPGPYGTLLTLPIINQPQVAILSTDGVKRRPVVVEGPDGSEAIAIHSVGNLALTWDHRAFDGAYAAAFLKAVKDIIEGRNWADEL
jgi:2-oxoglutarate dehydrogenase E2 component (dihydrolipoamide succinyltransferase)